MEIDKETLVKEGEEFVKMMDAFKRSPNPDAGEPCYLISCEWTEKYKHYIHFSDLKFRRAIQQGPDHC